MGFGRLLLQLVLVGALIAPATAQAKPGCLHLCGNVKIPYPFGMQGCSLNEDFLITCKKTDSKPPQRQAFLGTSNIEVTNITIDGELQIKSWASQSCHNASTGEEDPIKSLLTLSNFTVSSSKNKFTVVGCDSYAYLRGFRQGKPYSAGCMSTCDSLDYVYNKSCAGSGCCQIEIPDGLYSVNVTARSFNNHTGILDFSPCTYAFIVEDEKFNFSSQYLKNIPQDKFPVILEWSIDNTTNKEASRRFSSACGHNATSYRPDNVPGYRCRCEEGYDGNPYLGCQDIDECNKGLHNCSHQCINLDGSYKCTCPKGYTEDGRNDGQRCTPHHFPYIILALGVSIGFLVLLVAISWIFLFIRQRRLKELKEKFFQKNGGLILQQKLSMQHEIPDIFKIFTAEELKEATNNYDDSTIVGRGGFGTVYKGILADNREVAIKKSIQVDESQKEQFINEVVVLCQIKHKNVVRLLGCCLETEVPLLVYEFITNGTLFKHVHGRNASDFSWETRLKIAAETAGALSYLHSETSVPIVHRDVKTANILLDANYTAKVSDFGASRLVPLDEMQLSTIVQGTLGYLDPEYMRTSQLTEKSDVYSFGVVLVELLTGRKALCFDGPEEEKNLAMHFLSSIKGGKLFEILQKHIVNKGNKEQVKEVAQLAKRCLCLNGEERPSMKEVATELEGLHMIKMHPWVEVSTEETEYLLAREESFTSGHGNGCIASSAGFDSIKDHLVVSVGGGR